MKIRYVGSAGVRIIGGYTWNAENGYIQEVAEPEIVENLLTYPRPDFEPVEETDGQSVTEFIAAEPTPAPQRKRRSGKE